MNNLLGVKNDPKEMKWNKSLMFQQKMVRLELNSPLLPNQVSNIPKER